MSPLTVAQKPLNTLWPWATESHRHHGYARYACICSYVRDMKLTPQKFDPSNTGAHKLLRIL